MENTVLSDPNILNTFPPVNAILCQLNVATALADCQPLERPAMAQKLSTSSTQTQQEKYWLHKNKLERLPFTTSAGTNWRINLLKDLFFFFFDPTRVIQCSEEHCSSQNWCWQYYGMSCTTVDGTCNSKLLVSEVEVNCCIHGFTEPAVNPAHLSYCCKPWSSAVW